MADAWSAVVLLAVFFHRRLHRDTVAYAANHRFNRNRCSARLWCNGRQLTRVDMFTDLAVYDVESLRLQLKLFGEASFDHKFLQ